MILPHRFVMRIKRVNTYEAHLMMSGHSKYSKHVWCYSTDHLIQNLDSHLFVSGPATLQSPCPSLPCLWLLASFPYSKICFFPSWSFPGVLLPWEPPVASWVWGRKGLWIKAKESHHGCSSHYSSGPATMLAPRTDPDSGGQREGFMGVTPDPAHCWPGE